MRRRLKGFLFLSFMAVVCTPSGAQAAFYVNPWAGIDLGNVNAGTGFRTIGVLVGSAGAGFVGTEASVGYAPGIFGSGAKTYLLDLMSGVTIGPTFGRVALRGDVRYLRTFNATGAPNGFNVDLANFHYWRATVGIAIY